MPTPKNSKTQVSGAAARAAQLGDCLVTPGMEDRFSEGVVLYSQVPPSQHAAYNDTARESLEAAYGYCDNESPTRKSFSYQDGVAIIPVHGSLLNRFSYSWSFVTGYAYIRRQLHAAFADPDVRLIVLDVDSPGGEAAGCFELCEEIVELREANPDIRLISVVDSVGASGGYAIVAATERVIAAPSARVGSIGVLRMHVDYSGMYSEAGVQVTFVHSGKHKVDGNPYEPLPESVKADWKKSCDELRQEFATFVADARGLDVEAVLATEARVYRADEALDAGLIDAVLKPSDAVSSFLAEMDGSTLDDDEEEMNMTTPKKTPAEVTSVEGGAASVQAQIDAAVTADRKRVADIMALPEAEGRESLAQHLAHTGSDVESAKATLTVSPKATTAAPAKEDAADPVDTTNHLDAAMKGSQQPKVGAEVGAGDGDDDGKDAVSTILSDYEAATGRKVA